MAERFGRYETIRPIASGGMATVYLGKAVGEGGFERLVAIKVMHPHLAVDREFVAMFLDEARLAARIRHPNVVATFDVQKSDEGMFLVMDYVEGATLAELVRHARKQGETLATGMALRVVLDVLTGLHVAHELRDDQGELLNLIHRDVSPQNVLVGTDGVARLTDFGVARAESRLSSTRGGQLKGKIAYMAPEQIIDDPVDRRADVYAAGALLWEVLVGRRLFRAANDGALVHAVMAGARQSPTDAKPRVPEPVSRACMRALTATVADRYPTAAAFADELEDAAREAGLPVASSRAVASYVTQILPEIESNRELIPQVTSSSGAGGTPSGVSAGSGISDVASHPGATAGASHRSEGGSQVAPATHLDTGSGGRPNEEALPGRAASQADGAAGETAAPVGRGRLSYRAIGVVAVATAGALAVGLWLVAAANGSTEDAPSSAHSSGAANSADVAPAAGTTAPSSVSASTASVDAGVASAGTGNSAASAPSATATATASATTAARPRPTATRHPPRTAATSTSPKTSPTSYDPEQL